MTNRLFPRKSSAGPDWVFAEDVLSAVTYAECERLAQLACGGRVLEIGSYYGRSTIAMASTADSVHSVDPHEGGPPDAPGTLASFLENLDRHGVRGNVLVHVGLSTQLVPLFREAIFDLVFIDGIHQRPEVDVDLVVSLGCLRPGGTLALHDYGREGVRVGDEWHPFGVREALDEFLRLTGTDTPPEVVDTLAVVRSPDRREAVAVWSEGAAAFAAAVP